MFDTQHGFADRPDWQRQVRLRLAVCVSIATIVVAAILLLLRLPQSPVVDAPVIAVQVLVAEAPAEPAEEFTPIEEIAVPAPRIAEPLDRIPDEAIPEEALPVETVTRDWYADMESMVRDAVDASESGRVMQPAQLEARRRAAVLFAPSRAPVKKEIWENVEIDHIGRKVLVSGDCYRVLEDWRATYQDIQREFGQYMVHCAGIKRYPIGVDWIDEVGQKYAYVRYPDGEIPPDELNELIRKY